MSREPTRFLKRYVNTRPGRCRPIICQVYGGSSEKVTGRYSYTLWFYVLVKLKLHSFNKNGVIVSDMASDFVWDDQNKFIKIGMTHLEISASVLASLRLFGEIKTRS